MVKIVWTDNAIIGSWLLRDSLRHRIRNHRITVAEIIIGHKDRKAQANSQ